MQNGSEHMGRPKGSKNKDGKTGAGKKRYNDHKAYKNGNSMIEEVVEVEVEFICPVKGKIKQKVKMKRLKPIEVSVGSIVASNDDLDALDGGDTSDLPIYDEEE
jgi:hypothetical protein